MSQTTLTRMVSLVSGTIFSEAHRDGHRESKPPSNHVMCGSVMLNGDPAANPDADRAVKRIKLSDWSPCHHVPSFLHR